MANTFFDLSENDRNFAVNSLWIGFADTLLVLATQWLPFLADLERIAVAIMAGSLIGLLFIGRHDEFVQRMVGRAAVHACVVAGLIAFTKVMPIAKYIEIGPILTLALISLGFHVSLAWMRVRTQ